MDLTFFLKEYLKQRPLFLSLIRAKEAELYQKYQPLKHTILDVGCGDGYFAKVTFAKSIQLTEGIIDVGLDLKASRIKEARKLGVYKKLVTYDGRYIPFPKNSFQTVVSNCVLEHVEDLPALLGEVFRVLKPSGLFLTTVMARPWEDYLFGAKIFGHLYKDYMRKKQIHRNLYTKKEWDEVFKKVRFKIKEIKGYLSPQTCQLIDICHYISLPSLISYKLTGKWVLLPSIYPVQLLSKVLSQKVNQDHSGAIFYALKK